MVEGLTYEQFCKKYYEEATKMSAITIANYEKKYGEISGRADLEGVVDLAVSYALEKVYTRFDVNHESGAKLKTFMSTVVRNSTLSEISREKSNIRTSDKPKQSEDDSQAIIDFLPQCGDKNEVKEPYGRIEYSGGYKGRKEELIQHMLQCMKQLPPVDQVILKNWMSNQRTYVEDSIDELGWESNKANEGVISVRCNRAKKTLRRLVGEKPNYRDMALDNTPYIQVIGCEEEAIEKRKKETYSSIAKGVDYLDMASKIVVDSKEKENN